MKLDVAVPSRKELRHFGLIMFLVLSIGFGVVFPWFGGHSHRTIPLVVGVLFAFLALATPLLLKPVFVIWIRIGNILGWVNSRVILSVVYYLFVVPYGLVARLIGKDAMRRQWDKTAQSYRQTINLTESDVHSSMERPY